VLAKTLEDHILLLHSLMLDMGHQDLMFALLNSCPTLVRFFLAILLVLCFGEGMCILYHYILEVCNLVFPFYFYRGSQLTVCLETQRSLWTWNFEQCWNCSDFEDSLTWTSYEPFDARGRMLWFVCEISPTGPAWNWAVEGERGYRKGGGWRNDLNNVCTCE
jgi:hypothetical protein